MLTIEENQLWELKNVMIYRTKIEQGLIDNVCREMEKKIVLLGAKRISNPITATYSVEESIATGFSEVRSDPGICRTCTGSRIFR